MMQLFSKKTLHVDEIIEQIGVWWFRRSSIVFLFFFFIVIGCGVFSWYHSMYVFRWSEEREMEYRLSRNREVSFQKDRFESALMMLTKRKESFDLTPVSRDLFYAETK